MRDLKLHTVCEEARCPNIGECWTHGTATFMILGDICTRACGYCAVGHGRPHAIDAAEPARVADAVATLDLAHVVVTSVDRDDVSDGGASIFAETIREIRRRTPSASIEVLIPDFQGKAEPLYAVLDAGPDILNHNTETVPRLYRLARSGGRYERTLELLDRSRTYAPGIATKSGIMLGLGEEWDEIVATLRDLRTAGLRNPHARPVPAPVSSASADDALLPSRRIPRPERRSRSRWASRTSSRGRWSAAPTTPTSRRTAIARRCPRDLGMSGLGIRPDESFAAFLKHSTIHLRRQLSRVRVLPARMIRGDDDGPALRLVHCAVTEWWTRLHCDALSPPSLATRHRTQFSRAPRQRECSAGARALPPDAADTPEFLLELACCQAARTSPPQRYTRQSVRAHHRSIVRSEYSRSRCDASRSSENRRNRRHHRR